MFEESNPGKDHHSRAVCTCARELEALPCVAAVDVVPAAEAPSGTTTAEIVIPPGYLHRNRVPKRLVETIYDDTAPWTLGICEVTKRTPDHLTVFVR